jgi:hypothetical protein
MQYLLKSLPIGQKPLSEQDFYSICAKERVEVVWASSNFYCSTPLGNFICLDKRLYGIELLFAAFHELAHHWISAGEPYAAAGLGYGKDEMEADAIALVCIIPQSYLHRIDEILDLAPRKVARQIKHDRLALYFLFGV